MPTDKSDAAQRVHTRGLDPAAFRDLIEGMTSSDSDSPPDPDLKRLVGRHSPAQGVLPIFDGETILWCKARADHRCRIFFQQ